MILVTGASGVLGSALVRRLAAEGEAVRALLLPGDAAPRLRGLAGVERVVGDLTVPESLPPAARGVKAVFHAAGIVPFANGLRREMMAVNAEGAGRLLEAAAAAGVTDFLYVSSASTLGLPRDGAPLDENSGGWAGPSGYAYVDSKCAAEAHVAKFAGRMRTVTVNPGAIFAGDGTEPFSWAHLIWLVASGRLAANLPGGACVVGERDVTAGVMAAWRRGTPGRRYVLGSANVSYRELFAEVARQTGRPPLRLTAPPLVLQACGAVNSLRNRLAGDPLHAGPLNLENAGLLARRLYYRWDLAERELGFRPGPLGQLVSDVLSAMSESRRSRPDRDLPDVGRQAACRSRRSRTSRITRS